MTETVFQVRKGAYFDSVVLMQLQSSLAKRDGVIDAGVVMATPANLELLISSDLQVKSEAGPDDLLVVIKAQDLASGQAALAEVDNILKERRKGTAAAFRPKSLQAAAKVQDDATCVLISVPGRYATDVARDALELNKHVFLYSDNVAIDDEISLKSQAREKGLLLMGPDCGTAIIGGIGLGFANRVRRGSIGLVGASGTGLQAITSQIHQLGGGISQAIGTGGRDLKKEINAITTRQGISLLAHDSETDVIVLVSKPPEPEVAAQVIDSARSASKPTVICFLGYPVVFSDVDNIHFAGNLSEAADLAVSLVEEDFRRKTDDANGAGFVRGLFSGGTLAYELVLGLQQILNPLYTNVPIYESQRIRDVNISEVHTILDMGEDEFTQGRLHPMMNNDLRIRRLLKEAADPEVGTILFDLVLGEGAHPNPASELADAVVKARRQSKNRKIHIQYAALVIGTDEDPQNLEEQEAILRNAKIQVAHRTSEIISMVAARNRVIGDEYRWPLDDTIIRKPLKAINVGLETFTESLISQGSEVIQVDWKPPAGGNQQLISILSKMRSSN